MTLILYELGVVIAFVTLFFTELNNPKNTRKESWAIVILGALFWPYAIFISTWAWITTKWR